MDEIHRLAVELSHTVDVLRAELARVRKAFQVYAGHLGHCELLDQKACTCGFAETAHSVETGDWNPTT